ncbi:MAG: entericidin EcnA/B family protein [Alteraurantiacibacter sp.]
MKKILAVIALSSSALFVQACNTIDGAVDDVESVGDCVDGVEGNC